MNRVITVFALFTTILIFISTVVLGFVVYSIRNPTKPLFWLASTLCFGMFIALLICVSNIRTSVKLGELKAQKKTKDETSLTTCPDYWTKQIIHNDDRNERVVMCYNLLNNDTEKGTFIDGTLSRFDNSNGVADYTFNNTLFNNSAGSNLSDYRNMAKIANTTNIVTTLDGTTTTDGTVNEGFTNDMNIFGEFYNTHPDYDKFKHTHPIVNMHITGEITDNDNVEQHEHTYTNTGTGTHSHGVDFDITDAKFKNMYQYNVTNSNYDYWINPRDIVMSNGETKTAIEINLNELNKTLNPCELAKLFVWSEASSKCMS